MKKWKNTMMGLYYGHGRISHDSEDERDYQIEQEEIALKHLETGAIVKLTDDGFIDVFAGPSLGLRLDPHTKSINLFGENVNVMANQFNVRTKPYGFNWNGQTFNPNLYAKEESSVMTEAKNKVRYSDGMVDIMKDLGLMVETIDKEDF